MELSTLIKAHSLALTRPESDLVARLDSSIAAGSVDRYEQRLKDLAVARDLLKKLPDRKTTERRSRMEKAALLKERLKLLRQTIPFMSPSAAKSMSTEMKQIAAQLASLAGSSGGGVGSSLPVAAAAASQSAESGGNAGTAPDGAPTRETDSEKVESEQKGDAPPAYIPPAEGVKNGESIREERQLKETVEELRALYKAVLAALKRKQNPGPAGGRLSGYFSPLLVYADMPSSPAKISFKA